MFLLSNDYWEVVDTEKKGKGIFAKKDILPGTIIGDYLGTVINNATDETSDDDGLYLMYYHDRASIMPDKETPGIHLINHSCQPNTWMHTYRGHTLFFTLRHIFAGEELTISYLLSPDEDCKPCPHKCLCGKSNCIGTMHLEQDKYDKWREFTDYEETLTKRERIRYGKPLLPLDSYPKNIPDNPIYTLFGNTTNDSKQLSDTLLPSLPELREMIREIGRTLAFPKLKTRVIGVDDTTVIQEKL